MSLSIPAAAGAQLNERPKMNALRFVAALYWIPKVLSTNEMSFILMPKAWYTEVSFEKLTYIPAIRDEPI